MQSIDDISARKREDKKTTAFQIVSGLRWCLSKGKSDNCVSDKGIHSMN